MSRLAFILPLMVVFSFAADSPKQPGKPPADTSNMSSDVHAPLFQGPKSLDAGTATERLAGSLPRGAVASEPVPHRNFIDDRIFGKMEKDGVPHAPLATDQEFFRRVTLDLTGRIPAGRGSARLSRRQLGR